MPRYIIPDILPEDTGQGSHPAFGQALIDSLSAIIQRAAWLRFENVNLNITSVPAFLDGPPSTSLQTVPVPVSAQSRPPRPFVDDLLNIALDQLPNLSTFLDEEIFINLTDQLYSAPGPVYPQKVQDFLPLFYIVLAIALPYRHSRDLSECTCQANVEESDWYAVIAKSNSGATTQGTQLHLQYMTCNVIYLLQTLHVGAARDQFDKLCRSISSTNLSLLGPGPLPTLDAEKNPSKEWGFLWFVADLDLCIAGLLGRPALSDIAAIAPSVDQIIDSGIKNVQSFTRTSRHMILCLSRTLHIGLQLLMNEIAKTPVIDPRQSSTGSISGASDDEKRTPMSEPRDIMRMENELRQWHGKFDAIFPLGEVVPSVARARFDLEMHFFFAQILLYWPSLEYCVDHSKYRQVSQSRVAYCRTACIKVAIAAVTASEKYLMAPDLQIESPTSRHALFLSLMCLIAAFLTEETLPWSPIASTSFEQRNLIAQTFSLGQKLFRNPGTCNSSQSYVAKLDEYIRCIPSLNLG